MRVAVAHAQLVCPCVVGRLYACVGSSRAAVAARAWFGDSGGHSCRVAVRGVAEFGYSID